MSDPRPLPLPIVCNKNRLKKNFFPLHKAVGEKSNVVEETKTSAKVIPFKRRAETVTAVEKDHGEDTLSSWIDEASKIFDVTPNIERLEDIQREYEERYPKWKKARYNENLELSPWAEKVISETEGFASNGLEVLNTNPYATKPLKQQGWSDLYYPLNNLYYHKFKGQIQGYRKLLEKPIPQAPIIRTLSPEEIKEEDYVYSLEVKGDKWWDDFHKRHNSRIIPPPKEKSIYHLTLREKLFWLFNHNLITEEGVYAIFRDTVERQNQAIVIGQEGEKKIIEQFGRRWNNKRPGGYQVRKRMKENLIQCLDPVMLSFTISKEKITPLIPMNCNMDEVMFAIWNFGKWISDFNVKLHNYQQRRGIDWDFIGWVLEFMGEKEDTEERQYLNRGFPHAHQIMNGKWIGKITEIQELWPYGSVELTTKREILKRYPDRNFSPLSVANYITKYVNKAHAKSIVNGAVHKGYAWLAFSQGRLFALKHKKKDGGEK